MKEKYAIFSIQGGLGKHVAATAIAKTIKNNHKDRKLIVICAWPEVFQNLPCVDRVYQHGQTSYFYQTYVHDKDSIIFGQEPYFTTDHIHKKDTLIKNWCKMHGLKHTNEKPDVRINKLQLENAKKFWGAGSDKKPIMVIQTNGGPMTTDAKPYSWTRDMPEEVGQAIVDHYKDDYQIFQITKLNSPKLKGAKHVYATTTYSLTSMELFTILPYTTKRVFIDSCMQHAAAAFKLPSTVLWNGTSPKVFGYDIHDNITSNIPYECKLPGSVFFDFDFDGQETDYPFGDDDVLFDIDEIIKSIDKQ